MLDNARGRLLGKPLAIVDIGSNSVRLVSYESQSRAPTPTFNEKVLCGLGRGVAMSGLLPEDGVLKALAALQRFVVASPEPQRSRVVNQRWRVGGVHDQGL